MAGKTVDYYAGGRQLPTLPLLTYSESKNVAKIRDSPWRSFGDSFGRGNFNLKGYSHLGGR